MQFKLSIFGFVGVIDGCKEGFVDGNEVGVLLVTLDRMSLGMYEGVSDGI
jgi:hypothetical protein